MSQFQREVLTQIKRGIDAARHGGFVVEYPPGVWIDDEWLPWPIDMECA
jgi:hypothetical protein